MKYDILKNEFPQMPAANKGTKFVDFILSKASKDMKQPLLPMLFPSISAHLTNTNFEYIDGKLHEMCGQLGHLVAPSGAGKAQLGYIVEKICRDFRQHDDSQMQKLVEWAKESKTKGANQQKPERPEVFFRFPPADATNAAFIQNAMGCEKMGGYTQYLNLPEVEMADRICGGHRMVSQTIRNIFDRQRIGSLRASAEGVTGNPVIRANMTFSSTPGAAREFYKGDLTNGFFGRIPFAYKPRGKRSGVVPRQGRYDEKFQLTLDTYLAKLTECKGRFKVKPLNQVAENLAAQMAEMGDLTDNDTLWELSHRSILSAWKKGATLWVLNDGVWQKPIGEFVEWFCYYDLWSKLQVFGDMILGVDCKEKEHTGKRGVKNMLLSLPDSFSEAQLEALRTEQGMAPGGSKNQIAQWKFRGYITSDSETNLYKKTM